MTQCLICLVGLPRYIRFSLKLVWGSSIVDMTGHIRIALYVYIAIWRYMAFINATCTPFSDGMRYVRAICA